MIGRDSLKLARLMREHTASQDNTVRGMAWAALQIFLTDLGMDLTTFADGVSDSHIDWLRMFASIEASIERGEHPVHWVY